MSGYAVFTTKLEADLRAGFMTEATTLHRPASQVLRKLIREFVELHRKTREYDEFLGRKVQAGPASMKSGKEKANGEIETEYAS